MPPHRPQPPALRLKGGSWRTRGERPLRYRGAPPPRRAPHQLPRLPALRPSPLFQDHRRAGTDAPRADPTRRGPNTSRPSAVPSAPWRPGHSHPLPAAGSPGRPPPAPGPGLAVYLSSSPRRAPGRWRPRGDIRAPGSGSRPHLPAPRRRGGGATSGSRGRAHRAGRRGCPGSRPPLRDVRLAAQTRDRGRDARSPARHRPLTLAGEAGKEGKGDRGTRPPASSAAWRGAVSPRVVRGPEPPRPRRGRGRATDPSWGSPGRVPGALRRPPYSFQVWPSTQTRLCPRPLSTARRLTHPLTKSPSRSFISKTLTTLGCPSSALLFLPLFFSFLPLPLIVWALLATHLRGRERGSGREAAERRC